MSADVGLLAPVGLLGLLAVIAIVVFHMRRRTPPAVTLPSLRFWRPAEEDQADRNRLRRPPVSLPLILQVLAAAVIALGLARPVVGGVLGEFGQRTEPQHLIVVLDGSTSMNAAVAEDGSRTRWDLARQEAMESLREWQEGDVTTVMIAASRLDTFSASTRPQVDAALDRLARMTVPGGQMDLNAALELTRSLLLPDRSNRITLLTDGATQADPAVAARVEAPIELALMGESQGPTANYAITQVGARALTVRNDQYRLSITVSSFDANPARIPYRVVADGAEIVSSEVDLAAQESRTVQVNLPPAAREAQVSIQVRDGMEVDNRATILIDDAGLSTLDVLLLSDAPGPLERALAVIPGARVDVWETTTPGIKALAAPYDLVVFEGTTPAPSDIPDTPMVFVRPQAMEGAFAPEGVIQAPAIRQVALGDPMLEGVDLAGVTFAEVPMYRLSGSGETLVEGESGGQNGPLIWRGMLADRPYVSLGFDIASSNLSQRVAFPVLISQIVRGLTEDPLPGAIAIGDPLVYRPSTATDVVEFTTPGGGIERLSHTSSPAGGPGEITFRATGEPGTYITRELRADGSVVGEGAFVVNAGHPSESDLRPRPELEQSLIGGDARGSSRDAVTRAADLWPILVAAATLLILAEWLVWIQSIGLGRFSMRRTSNRFRVRMRS